MDKLEFGRNKQLLTFLIQESKLKLKKTSLDSDTKTRVETNLQLLIQERELLIKNYDEGQTALLQSNIENVLKELKKVMLKILLLKIRKRFSA